MAARTRINHRPRLRVPITHLDDVVLATDKAVWTWVRLPEHSDGFQTTPDIVDYVVRNSSGLAKLVNARDDIHGQLRITHVPTSPQHWADAVATRPADPDPAWRTYMDHQAHTIGQLGHMDRRVHLGIRVAAAAAETFFNTGPFRWFRKGTATVEKAAGLGGGVVSVEEVRRRHASANTVRASLRSSMGAIPIDHQELVELILNSTNPGMRPPEMRLPARQFGPGLQELLFNDPIDVHNRAISYLDINDEPIMHAAYLAVARTEGESPVGETDPWLWRGCADCPFPIDWNITFRASPHQSVSADLRSKTAHAKDMYSHMVEAGKTPPRDLVENVALLEQFEYEVTKGRRPGLYAQYIARVCDPDMEVLASKAQTVKDAFSDQGIEVQWPSGDQLDYALAEVPAGPIRRRPYNQHTNLYFLFGGGPTWSSAVGDKVDKNGLGHIGAGIGNTVGGGVPVLVSFDPLAAVARNRGGGFLVVGSSGSGKSFLFMKLAFQLALQRVTLIVIDPKGDIVDPSGRTFRLPELIGAVTGRTPHVIDTYYSPDGILEPFRLGQTPSEGVQLAHLTLESLLGGSRVGSDSAQAALARAINAEADTADPTLTGVLNRLHEASISNKNEAAAAAADNLYQQLQLYRRMPQARLLFGEPGQVLPAVGTPGDVTIISTRGIERPPADKAAAELTGPQRLGGTLLSLITRWGTVGLLAAGEGELYPKGLLVDEAHALTATEGGRAMLVDNFKMLRSRNGVVGVCTQELSNFDLATGAEDDRITNNVTTSFGFNARGAKTSGAVERTLQLIKPEINPQDPFWQDEIRSLNTGECYMRDVDGRIARMVTDRSLESENLAFETNPTKRKVITVEQVQAALTAEFGVTWQPTPRSEARIAAETAHETAVVDLSKAPALT